MLRDFAATVCTRPARVVAVLAVVWLAVAATGCGIKGPLRPAPSAAPPVTDVGPPAPSPEPEASAPRK